MRPGVPAPEQVCPPCPVEVRGILADFFARWKSQLTSYPMTRPKRLNEKKQGEMAARLGGEPGSSRPSHRRKTANRAGRPLATPCSSLCMKIAVPSLAVVVGIERSPFFVGLWSLRNYAAGSVLAWTTARSATDLRKAARAWKKRPLAAATEMSRILAVSLMGNS